MSTFLKSEERKSCWEAKDNYFTCLSNNNEDQSKCQELKKLFECKCPNTWVKHFERKYEYEKYKARLLTEGARKKNS
ncbi:cytochrome c oxidase assembly factor 6 homolog [Saccoglossus kowalevskii]